MHDDDGRDIKITDDIDDLVAVLTTVDAVLVLDDGNIVLVEQIRTGRD